MKDELTELMHSEFTVSKEVDIELRAGCVWGLLEFNASEKDIRREAKAYGITYEDAMRYKKLWYDLHTGKRKVYFSSLKRK